jgi:hypothetical protein
MSALHTPEPWVVDDFGLHVFSGRRLVAGTGGHQDNFTADLPEINKANSRRIVACVNACSLMPIEDVEELAAADHGVMRVVVLADDYKQERDELAAALRMCIQSLDNARDQVDFISDSADKARAALAKLGKS